MKRFIAVILNCALAAVPAFAQNTHTIKGQAIDKENGEPIPMAAVQVLSLPDSTQVKGVVTDEDGRFSIAGVGNGKFTVKISFVGYRNNFTALNTSSESGATVDLKQIKVNPDTQLLEEAVITAEVPKVQAVEDTLVFNSAAYRVAEGSSIQELIKKLPGVEVDENGSMTVNGKEVTQILVNGKEFMSDDLETLLKNLPANMVDRLKTYERKSDLARITGIDDGEEQTVFDLQIKQEMMGGLITNIDLAYGSDDLYNGRVMVNRFNDYNRLQIFANATNVIDQGVGNGGRQWGNNRGQNTRQDLFGTYSYESDKLEINSNFGVSHNENDFRQTSSSEYFYGSSSTFSNGANNNRNKNMSFHANLYFEWKPDTMTNIIFRPNFNSSNSEGNSDNRSATFSGDPYKYMDDPLAEMDAQMEYIYSLGDSIFTNRNIGMSGSEGDSRNGSFNLQANRKLNDKGRNITVRSNGNFNNSHNDNTSYNTTEYFRLTDVSGGDSINIRNRYTRTPSDSWNFSVQLMYTEPIFKTVFWQTSYRFSRNSNTNDRQTYSFDNMPEYDFYHHPEDWANYRDMNLSKYAEYTTTRHEIQTSIRWVQEEFNLNVGVRYQPYTTRLEYTQGDSYDITKNLYDLNPTLDFRYNFTKQKTMRVRYNGNSSQPSMTNLLPIRDETNPLYITEGNPDLKPSFSNNLNIEFRSFDSDKQSGFVTRGNLRTTSNSISNRVSYNEENGGSTTRPENINGNWNAYYMIGGNFALKDKRYTFSLYPSVNYSNQVGYLYQNQQTVKSTTKTFSPNANANASFRDDNLEMTLSGNVHYNSSRNDIRENGNMDTWNYSFGPSGNVTLPWDIRIYADLIVNSRRGYSDASFNTDEVIWNMQISKSFLKNKAAMISVQAFDILGQRKNYSRNMSASSKSDTQYNSINQYFMVHFVYRLNMFNGQMVEDEDMEEEYPQRHRRW
ncbi:MAG: TonB-dependent receptor [Bacteroidaceae bacterium]|nr:TonB-dependent receptor [Bacteroidaceae bacterium]